LDWADSPAVKPNQPGIQVISDYDLEALTEFIDWTPFFTSWQLKGKFPDILKDEVVGTEAQKLYNDARSMLRQIIDEKWLTAKAIFGLFPANAIGDESIAVYEDESRSTPTHVLHFLRQQRQKAPGQPNLSLSDYIRKPEDGPDYIGAFAVTSGVGIEEHVKRFEAEHDDYNAILLKALADRLAEALAEQLHLRVRKEFWGYAKEETLQNDALIAEQYEGIRPAPGYPACPEHTEKGTIWDLLQVEDHIGIRLTESYAMYPAASVSGYYFAHPASKYFGLGQISKDQVKDYANRKGMSVETAERWLAPVLNYDV
jgi:5-methyltetrahydrofolate--homocysteine methyltransferase